MFHTTDVLTDLNAWSTDASRDLPRDAYDISFLEYAGAIVDLDSGQYFTQTDNWIDFTNRWLAEQTRRGKTPDVGALAAAIHKANTRHYDYPFCLLIAVATLRDIAK